MTTVFEVTAGALTTLAVPFGQNTYHSADGTIPDQYLVYQEITGVGKQHADNEEINRMHRIQVTCFSRTGLASLPDVDGAMRAAGFTLGPERELPQDISTEHYILAKDYFILLDKE
jgi:hypothetical protein